jgi:HK97 gp10 family phage protein
MADSKIEGLGDLRATFATLRDDMKNKTSLKMVSAGGQVLKKESRIIAQSKGLRKTGALINNIVIKREKNVEAGVTQYNLGVRHGYGLGKTKHSIKYLAIGSSGRIVVKRTNDPFYWSFLEFGHKTVAKDTGQEGGGTTTYTQKLRNGRVVVRQKEYSASSLTGRRRNPTGFVKATPFIAPALVNKRQEAIDAMEAQLQKEIERANKS